MASNIETKNTLENITLGNSSGKYHIILKLNITQ